MTLTIQTIRCPAELTQWLGERLGSLLREVVGDGY